MVLGGRVRQVVEDYDPEKCRQYYSDSSYVSSTRSDAVSEWPLTATATDLNFSLRAV